MEGGDRTGEGLAGRVAAAAAAPLAAPLDERRGLARIGRRTRLGKVELQLDVEPERARQLERPLEQPAGGALVIAPERPPAGGGQPLAGALARVAGSGCPSSCR